MSLDMVKAVDFKGFCYMRKQTWCEETFFIEGCFKHEGDEDICSGDNFEAHRVLGLSVEEIYKLYIEWFNYTLRPYEKKRIFVSAREVQND